MNLRKSPLLLINAAKQPVQEELPGSALDKLRPYIASALFASEACAPHILDDHRSVAMMLAEAALCSTEHTTETLVAQKFYDHVLQHTPFNICYAVACFVDAIELAKEQDPLVRYRNGSQPNIIEYACKGLQKLMYPEGKKLNKDFLSEVFPSLQRKAHKIIRNFRSEEACSKTGPDLSTNLSNNLRWIHQQLGRHPRPS